MAAKGKWAARGIVEQRLLQKWPTARTWTTLAAAYRHLWMPGHPCNRKLTQGAMHHHTTARTNLLVCSATSKFSWSTLPPLSFCTLELFRAFPVLLQNSICVILSFTTCTSQLVSLQEGFFNRKSILELDLDWSSTCQLFCVCGSFMRPSVLSSHHLPAMDILICNHACSAAWNSARLHGKDSCLAAFRVWNSYIGTD